MHDVVRMSSAKLKEIFALTAKQMSMSPGIVEKDYAGSSWFFVRRSA